MAAIAGYGGSVLVSSLPNVALTNEALTDAGDHKTFSEPSAIKQYWDRSATFVVQTAPDGTTWTTADPSTYSIRYVSGQVVFNTAISGATPACRISSGAYLPYSTFGNMKSWEVVPAVDMLDSSVFGSNWKQYLPALLGATAKLSQFYADNTLSSVVSNPANNVFVLSMKTGRTATERWEGFARFKQDDIKNAVNALVTEDLDVQIDGQLYFFN